MKEYGKGSKAFEAHWRKLSPDEREVRASTLMVISHISHVLDTGPGRSQDPRSPYHPVARGSHFLFPSALRGRHLAQYKIRKHHGWARVLLVKPVVLVTNRGESILIIRASGRLPSGDHARLG